MSRRGVLGWVVVAGGVLGGAGPAWADPCNGEFTQDFRFEDCTFVNRGRTAFFVLEPGYQLRYAGTEGQDTIDLTITVLRDTELVDGVRTRVVEERELVNGELVEVSRNFFAICSQRSDVVYFGEDVDIYEGGEVVSHEGAWRAGVGGAHAGILMPGTFLLGARYYQEVAPEVALDRACHTAMNLTETTLAGSFSGCVEVAETTPLTPSDLSVKRYCPGIGLVRDGDVALISYGP